MARPGSERDRAFLRHNPRFTMNEHTIIVINTHGRLRVLFCPFRVRCIKPVGNFNVGNLAWVERVICAEYQNKIQYQIYGVIYQFECFAIQINF